MKHISHLSSDLLLNFPQHRVLHSDKHKTGFRLGGWAGDSFVIFLKCNIIYKMINQLPRTGGNIGKVYSFHNNTKSFSSKQPCLVSLFLQ